MEPVLRQRVNNKTKIAMIPGRAKRQPPQIELKIIPDDTDGIPPEKHPYYGSTFKAPLVNSYNTRSRRLKVHKLMYNQVTKIQTSRQIPTPTPTNTPV